MTEAKSQDLVSARIGMDTREFASKSSLSGRALASDEIDAASGFSYEKRHSFRYLDERYGFSFENVGSRAGPTSIVFDHFIKPPTIVTSIHVSLSRELTFKQALDLAIQADAKLRASNWTPIPDWHKKEYWIGKAKSPIHIDSFEELLARVNEMPDQESWSAFGWRAGEIHANVAIVKNPFLARHFGVRSDASKPMFSVDLSVFPQDSIKFVKEQRAIRGEREFRPRTQKPSN